MSKLIIFSLFIFISMAYSQPYYIRFINNLEGEFLNIQEQNSEFQYIGGVGFMDITNYTAVSSNNLAVMARSNVTGNLFTSYQGVTWTKYCTVVILMLNGEPNLISYDEVLGTSSEDSSIQNPFWFRVIDLRSYSNTTKLGIYNPDFTMNYFEHIGYLYASPYRVVDAVTTTSILVQDETSLDQTTISINYQQGDASTLFVYSDSQSTMQAVSYYDRPIAVYTPTQTEPIGSTDQGSSSFSTKIKFNLSLLMTIIVIFTFVY